MLLIYGAESRWTEEERRECMIESMGICDELAKEGKWIASSPLHSVNTLGYLGGGDVARRLHPAPPLGEQGTLAGVSRAVLESRWTVQTAIFDVFSSPCCGHSGRGSPAGGVSSADAVTGAGSGIRGPSSCGRISARSWGLTPAVAGCAAWR
jgi:hypothetical protein